MEIFRPVKEKNPARQRRDTCRGASTFNTTDLSMFRAEEENFQRVNRAWMEKGAWPFLEKNQGRVQNCI